MALSNEDRSALVSEATRAMEKLRAEPTRIAALLVKLRGQLAAAATGEVNVGSAGAEASARAQRAADARASAADTLAAYRSLAEGARERAEKAFTVAATNKASDNSEALVLLLERQEAWKRVERQHALPLALATVQRIAQDAASRGDRRTLEALRAEIPSAIASPDPRPAARRQVVDVAFDVVDRAEEPLLSPIEQTARAGLRELRQAWPRLETTFSLAEHEIKGRSIAAMLVNFDPAGSTFAVGA